MSIEGEGIGAGNDSNSAYRFPRLRRRAFVRVQPSRASSFQAHRANLKDDAARYLRQLILTGELHRNEKIDQDAIASQLRMSKLPVRGALIGLTHDYWVVTKPQRGAFVARLERTEVLDHSLVFGLVSGIAAGRAADSLTSEELCELRAVQAELANATDAEHSEELNFRFHQVINSAASARLSAVIRLFLRSLPSHYFKFVPDWTHLAVKHHRQILQALEARDASAARAAMELHLTTSGQQAVAILERSDFWSGESGAG